MYLHENREDFAALLMAAGKDTTVEKRRYGEKGVQEF